MRRLLLCVLGFFVVPVVITNSTALGQATAAKKAARTLAKPQTRPAGERVKVDPQTIHVGDGDTVTIKWPSGDSEIVRILGIDTPETRNLPHNLPFDEPFGREARAFAAGAFATATDVRLLRCTTVDPYDRTLGYLFVNGKNYSILVIKAGLAAESVSFYGDNGFPEIAAEITAAAKAAGPTPFEPPHLYRGRMRILTDAMKKNRTYPKD